MKKNIRNMRWHLAKKRWAKSRSEFFYDIRQNIKLIQKGIKHFFVKSKYERNTKTKAPVHSFVVILTLGVLGYAAYEISPFLWDRYKAYELHNYSLDYLEENDISQAFWSAYTSYNYDLKNPRYENLKVLTKTALLLDHFETHNFLKALAHHKKATISDSILYIRYSLDKNNHAAADEHFPKIKHLVQGNPNVRLLHLRILAQNWRHHYDAVLQLARELVHVHKMKNPALDQIYLNIAMRESDYAKESIAHMFQLAQGKDLSSLIALRKAMQPLPYNDFSPEQTDSFLFDYLKHPLATWEDQLNALTEAFRRGVIPHTELDVYVRNQFPVDSPGEMTLSHLKRMLTFFQNINLPHKILKYVTPELAVKDKLFLVDYIMIMLDSGKYTEAGHVIDSILSGFSKSERHILNALSRMKREEGGAEAFEPSVQFTGILGKVKRISDGNEFGESDSSFVNSFFDLAFASASAKELHFIEHLFDHLPHNSSLHNYLERMSIESSVEETANILLLLLFREKGNEAEIVKILKSLDIDLGGMNESYVSQICYLKILYQIDREKTLHLLEKEASVVNVSSEMIIALSLAYYLNGEPLKALRTLEECKLNFLFKRPGNQVIAALIFNANDRSQDSRHFVSNLNMEALLAPERQLVLRLLQSGNQNPEKI